MKYLLIFLFLERNKKRRKKAKLDKAAAKREQEDQPKKKQSSFVTLDPSIRNWINRIFFRPFMVGLASVEV